MELCVELANVSLYKDLQVSNFCEKRRHHNISKQNPQFLYEYLAFCNVLTTHMRLSEGEGLPRNS